MYYSAKQYTDYVFSQRGIDEKYRVARMHTAITGKRVETSELTPAHVIRVLRDLKADTASRNARGEERAVYYGKWTRPWEVVPELRDFRPPEGDYGVGIEIEMGFNSLADSQYIARKVKRWQYITLDYEGGDHPIEATFPPVKYSRFNKSSQSIRYLKLLKANKERVYDHAPDRSVGTHVNVSVGSNPRLDGYRVQAINNVLRDMDYLPRYRYFGRHPYGYGEVRNFGESAFVEWKLFNSTIEPKRLQQYVDIAVELTALVAAEGIIDMDTVTAAAERGYKKSGYEFKLPEKMRTNDPEEDDYDEDYYDDLCDCPDCRSDRGEI